MKRITSSRPLLSSPLLRLLRQPPISLAAARVSSKQPNFSPFTSLARFFSTMSGGIDSPQPDVDWPANRVRDTFIKFFEEKNHVDWKSSPVVPVNDPTLLFANAGTQNPHLITIFNIISLQFCHFLLI